MFCGWRVGRNELDGPFVAMRLSGVLGCHSALMVACWQRMITDAGLDLVTRGQAHSGLDAAPR